MKNVLLAAASFVFTWLLLELWIVPLALPLMPLRIHAALPRGIRPLAQSSKTGTLPERYVALIGDSHAQGGGDWLLSVDASRNPPFHSAHLLHDKTGRDVISFGASGAGSLRAMATEPEAFLDYLERTWRYRLPEPELLLIYFYEGNDLQDNLRDLDHTYFQGGFDPGRIYEGDYFRSFVKQTAAMRTPVAEDLASWSWVHNFFLARFVLRIAEAALDRSWEKRDPPHDWSPGGVNRARIGDVERALPDWLQAPPLELGPDEIELSLWAHAQAFAVLRERFPGVRTLLVYLPSPLATYRITSPEVDVQVQRGEAGPRFASSAVPELSDRLCRRIEGITRAGAGGFLDVRPALWQLSAREPVHGPRDWKHLNRIGQERLADTIALALEQGSSTGCASLVAHLGGS